MNEIAKGHVIQKVLRGSIAEKLDISPGDRLYSVNGQEIEDIFDYQYQVQNEAVKLLIKKKDGEQKTFEVNKNEDEDLGLIFENGLMDEYRSCHNKCIFCFIDQMPKGMRETLYFKDDDSRLSFLQGNYVTLTNLSEHDLDRIIKYRLSPINISFQTMNPNLRCMMLNNRFAGEALKKADRLYEAGIAMNGQIVLCKGINDGEELAYSIRRLSDYIPVLESVSVVPVGLSKYREGLYPLVPFDKEDAGQVLDMIHDFQKKIFAEHGTHFIHASDEWYILAERELPGEENYDGYPQLENGVGMLRLFLEEYDQALSSYLGKRRKFSLFKKKNQECAVATGRLAYPYMKDMAQRLMEAEPGLKVHVYPIRNVFFGESITVSGLITGQDIIAQLTGKSLGGRLLIPQNMLRSGEYVFLDDVTVSQVEKALQVKIDIVKSSGYDFVEAILGNG